MADRARVRARVRARQKRMVLRRTALLAALGSTCARCGARDRLEFDHPRGRTWRATDLAPWMRIKRYEQDAREGNLRLLCRPCNASSGAAWRRIYAERRERQEQAEYAAGMAAAMGLEDAA